MDGGRLQANPFAGGWGGFAWLVLAGEQPEAKDGRTAGFAKRMFR